MTEEAATLQLLIDSILEKHRELRKENETDSDTNYVDFTELEIRAMVESLWTDRFASSRQRFRESVGAAVASQIEKS
jgi:hypothetical protein